MAKRKSSDEWVRSRHGRATPIRRMLAEGGDKYDQAVKKIRTVLAANRGRIQDAAAKLHVSSRTLSRWIKDHNIQKFASELRKKHSVPGPRPT